MERNEQIKLSEQKRDLLRCIADNIPDDVVLSTGFNNIVIELTKLALSIRPKQGVSEQEKTATETSGSARKGGRKSEIDTGKILALHNAGWSNMKIAGELGIHNTTVSYHLRKLKEAEDEADHQSDD